MSRAHTINQYVYVAGRVGIGGTSGSVGRRMATTPIPCLDIALLAAFYLDSRKRSTITGSIGSVASV